MAGRRRTLHLAGGSRRGSGPLTCRCIAAGVRRRHADRRAADSFPDGTLGLVGGGEAAEERCQRFPVHRGVRHRQRERLWLPCWRLQDVAADSRGVAVRAGVRLDLVSFHRPVERPRSAGEAESGDLGQQCRGPQVRVVGQPSPAVGGERCEVIVPGRRFAGGAPPEHVAADQKFSCRDSNELLLPAFGLCSQPVMLPPDICVVRTLSETDTVPHPSADAFCCMIVIVPLPLATFTAVTMAVCPSGFSLVPAQLRMSPGEGRLVPLFETWVRTLPL